MLCMQPSGEDFDPAVLVAVVWVVSDLSLRVYQLESLSTQLMFSSRLNGPLCWHVRNTTDI